MTDGIIQTNYLLIMGQSIPTHDQTESETGDATAKLAEHFANHDDRSTDWLQLDDQEEVLWMGSPTLRQLVVPFGLSILVLCSGLFAIAIGIFELFGDLPSSLRWAAVAAGGLLIVVTLVLDFSLYRTHQRIRYAITTGGLYRRWNGSNMKQIERRNMTGSTCHQSWLDRQFSCGQVRVTSSKVDGPRLFFSAVSNPEIVRDTVSELLLKQR